MWGARVPRSWVAEHGLFREKVRALLVSRNFLSLLESATHTGAARVDRMFRGFAWGLRERMAALSVSVTKRPKLVSPLEEFLAMRRKYQELDYRFFFLAGKSKCFMA